MRRGGRRAGDDQGRDADQDWPTLRGSLAVEREQPWEEDAPATARLREQGAVLIGKTTTPVRLEGSHGLRAHRHHPQSMGHRQDTGRLERRRRGRRGARHGRPARRHGRRRLDPHSCRLHRRVRPEAKLRPGPSLSREPVRHGGARRAADAYGERRRGHAQCVGSTRQPRLVRLALRSRDHRIGLEDGVRGLGSRSVRRRLRRRGPDR